jgi:four helix bundle protein
MDFVVECYRLSEAFPRSEVDGLASQLQRAAVSIPANIAEGQGRTHVAEFLHHLSIAYGSLREAETHVGIAPRLRYLEADAAATVFGRAAELGRLLNGLMRSLRRSLASREPPGVDREPRTANRELP